MVVVLFGRDGEFFSTGAFPLESINDPTGAGDCFAGGADRAPRPDG